MNMVLARSGVRRFMANPVVPGSRRSTVPGQIIVAAVVPAVLVLVAVVLVATAIIAVRDRTSRLLAVVVQPDLLVF
jgi:hypothetical protein